MSFMLLVTAIVTALSGQAVGEGGFALKARVGTACQASVAGNDTRRSGDRMVYKASVSERCNQPGGYQLVLHHPAGMHGAFAQSGDRRVDLNAAGTETIVAESDMAGVVERELSVDYKADTGPIDFNVELRPNGRRH